MIIQDGLWPLMVQVIEYHLAQYTMTEAEVMQDM
jgi:hypothetical protein